MKIIFFDISTKKILEDTDDEFFVMKNQVYRNNGRYLYSKTKDLDFNNFIERARQIDWAVTD
jgi:hypothetical protein